MVVKGVLSTTTDTGALPGLRKKFYCPLLFLGPFLLCPQYAPKMYFPNHDILYTVGRQFLQSLRITIELGSKNEYFGLNDVKRE